MIPEALTEKFHPSLVKKNQANQDYVAIDGYINRLNEVLGHAWAWQINSFEVKDAPPTKSGKPQYIAVVQGTLTIILSDIGIVSVGEDGDDAYLTTQKAMISRDGIGAGQNFDIDTAVKTAQAEALKKACHQYGIALYLWDVAERDFVELQRQAATNDTALKKLVVAHTQRALELDPGTLPEKEQMQQVLGIEEFDVDTIRTALTTQGVL